jgi:hypothetical protein
MTLAELLKLIEETADKPSPAIDWLVEVTVLPEVAVPHHDERMNQEGYVLTAPGTQSEGSQAYRPPNYSGSIDAAAWLVEQVRPGWNFLVCSSRTSQACDEEEPVDDGFWGCVWPDWHPHPIELNVSGHARTPGMAIVAALIKSLMQGETQ